jgi:hypothetical protein
MSYVVSLEQFKPGQRYGDVGPWTRVRIEEAEAYDGPYTPIDELNLDPLDADPAQPQTRNFTTAEATIPAGWFKVVFLDAQDAEQPSRPVYFPSISDGTPTLEELKRQVNVDRADKEPLLEAKLQAAIEFARNQTGRQLDPLPDGAGTHSLTRRVSGGRSIISVPDAREIVTVTIDGVEVEPAGFYSDRGLITDIELPVHTGSICEISGKFGFDPLPDDLRQAIIEEAANRYYERETGNADSAASEEYGQLPYSRPPGWARAVFKSYRLPLVA